MKATSHGRRRNSESRLAASSARPRLRVSSSATTTMLAAINASNSWVGARDEPERRECQGHAVAERERGDRQQDLAAAADEKHQPEHEHQVIDPAEDVLDAERDVGRHDVENGVPRGRHLERRAIHAEDGLHAPSHGGPTRVH